MTEGNVINKDKVIELVQNIVDIDEQITDLRKKKNSMIEEGTQHTGVPDKKTLKIAIALAKKSGVSMDDVEALVGIIEPLVQE